MSLPHGHYRITRAVERDDFGETILCRGCGERLPVEFFSVDGGIPASQCKACRAERCREWYRRRGRSMRQARRENAV